MNILLTGSGGFIGRNLKEYLQDKYTLFCPRSYELDLTNEKQLPNISLHMILILLFIAELQAEQEEFRIAPKHLIIILQW